MFKKKPTASALVAKVGLTARLNARLQPLDRGYFEDPLDEVLKRLGLGEVSGGGTQMAEEPAGIAFSDLEITVHEASEATVSIIIGELERLGAPKRSVLLFETMPDAIARTGEDSIVAVNERGKRPFGRFEGLGLFLNGTDLPDEVYANSDSNQLVAECQRLMGDANAYWSYWNGSRETALYFYGPSFERMKAAIDAFVASEPACEKSRIEQIA